MPALVLRGAGRGGATRRNLTQKMTPIARDRRGAMQSMSQMQKIDIERLKQACDQR